MSKSILGLLGLLIVLLAAFWFLRKQDTAAKMQAYPDRELAVENGDEIDRVFIADLRGRTMNLTRQPNGDWLVDDSVKASATIMERVVQVLSQLRIDHIPPNTMVPTIMESMRTTGIKIEVYNKENERLRSLILGRGTHDDRASFMMVEGQSQPYAVTVPGFTGTMRPLFSIANVEDWRSRDWLAIPPEKIEQVSIDYPNQPGASFRIERDADSLRLEPGNPLVKVTGKSPRQRLLESYLEGYVNVALFRREDNLPAKDSLKAMSPFAYVNIRLADGSTEELRLIPAYSGIPVEKGGFTNYWVIQKPGRLLSVQATKLQPWLREYRSFFVE